MVAHRAGAVVELEGRGREEAAAREDLALGVVDHVVAERPDAREATGRAPRRLDHLADEELRCVIHGRELELLLGAEVGEEAALAHAGRLGEPADRQRLETFLGRERRGRLQDRVARPLALGS